MSFPSFPPEDTKVGHDMAPKDQTPLNSVESEDAK